MGPPVCAVGVRSAARVRSSATRPGSTPRSSSCSTGARYLVADLSQVSGCDPAALVALARAARRLSSRHGWLRLVATSPVVVTALDTADVRDVVDLYHAHNGTGDAS